MFLDVHPGIRERIYLAPYRKLLLVEWKNWVATVKKNRPNWTGLNHESTYIYLYYTLICSEVNFSVAMGNIITYLKHTEYNIFVGPVTVPVHRCAPFYYEQIIIWIFKLAWMGERFEMIVCRKTKGLFEMVVWYYVSLKAKQKVNTNLILWKNMLFLIKPTLTVLIFLL